MIDSKVILQLGKLSRLDISENEVEIYAKELSHIFKYFEQISKINTEGVAPLITPVEIVSRLRNDEASNELSTEELLKNAPEKMGNLFKVPPVV